MGIQSSSQKKQWGTRYFKQCQKCYKNIKRFTYHNKCKHCSELFCVVCLNRNKYQEFCSQAHKSEYLKKKQHIVGGNQQQEKGQLQNVNNRNSSGRGEVIPSRTSSKRSKSLGSDDRGSNQHRNSVEQNAREQRLIGQQTAFSPGSTYRRANSTEIDKKIKMIRANVIERINPFTELYIGPLVKLAPVNNTRMYYQPQSYIVATVIKISSENQLQAVKVLPIDLLDSTIQGEIYSRQQIQKNQQTKLQNIVRCQGIYCFEHKIYLFMELMPLDLKELQHRIPLSPIFIAYIIKQVLNGLIQLHNCRFVHADLKPGNILVNQHGEFKIADFGQCQKMTRKPLTRRHGTQGYRSDAQRYDEREDIYELGRTTLFLVVGNKRWNQKYKRKQFLEKFYENKSYNEKAREFIRCCVNFIPQKRWTAEQLMQSEFIKCVDQPQYKKEILLGLDLSKKLIRFKKEQLKTQSNNLFKQHYFKGR